MVSGHLITKLNTYWGINLLYTSGLFHYYMLDKFICHFRGVRSMLLLFILFLMENPVSKHC